MAANLPTAPLPPSLELMAAQVAPPPVAGTPASPTGPPNDPPDYDQIVRVLETPVEDLLAYRSGNQFHAKLLQKLIVRRDASTRAYSERRIRWDSVDDHMQMRVDLTAGAKYGDGTRSTTKKEMPYRRSIAVPASFAALMVRHTQELGLMLAREPEMQIEGAGPEDADRAKLVEASIAYDLRQMVYPLQAHQLCFDAERYGLAIWYLVWERDRGMVLTPPLISMSALKNPIVAKIVRKIMPGALQPGREWQLKREYNRIIPVDPRLFYKDPRRSTADLQDGEWCGHGWATGYMGLKSKGQELGGPYFNLDAVRKFCGNRPRTDSRRNPDLTERPAPAQLDENDAGTYNADHLQIRIIPREWGLGPGEDPEIWWFTWIDDTVIIRCHPSPYAHGRYSYGAAEGIPDAHSLQNPGWGEQIDGLQLAANWIFNTRIQALRTMLNGGGLVYSPTWMNETDITHPNPAGSIRLKKGAEEMVLQGRLSIQQLYGQLLTQDPTAGHLRDLGEVFDLIQRLTGANDPTQGIPLPDKRTLGEVNAILANASQRIGTTTRLLDAQCVREIATQMIANRQQFTSTEQWYRIPGDLAKELEGRIAAYRDRVDQTGGQIRALVGPQDMWGNFDYIPHTGNMSQDPSKSPDTWIKGLQVIGQVWPIIANPQFNPGGKIPDLDAFVKEIVRSLGIKQVDQFWKNLPPAPAAPPAGPGGPAMPPGALPANVNVVPDEQYAAGVQAGNYV